MSVLTSDLRLYGAANMPEADGATVGGAINFTKRVEWADISASGLFDAVSSSASDTATKIIYAGRDTTGAIQSETLTLTGTTKVAGTKTLERLLYGLTSTASSDFGLTTPGGTLAVGDVALMAHTLTISAHTAQAAANATATAPATITLQSGDGASVSVGQVIRILNNLPVGVNFQLRRIIAINPGGAGADVVAVDRNWGTVPSSATTYEVAFGFHFELAGSNGGVALSSATQVLGITRMFATATADVSGGSTRNFYEKVFVNNNNQTTALTSAQLEVLSESPSLPSGALLDMGLATGYNDTATITNRQTAPAGVSFTTQPAFISAPAPGNLAASASSGSATGALAMWLRLQLAAGTAAYKGAATLRTQGATT